MKSLVVSKEDLTHNINRIKKYAKEKSGNGYTIIGIVKGNGYGLGLKKYATFLVNNGISYLAVANLEEAIILSEEKITDNILILSPLNDKKDMEIAVSNNLIVTIDSIENAKMLNEIARAGHNIRVHIKVDTGFGRYGFLYNKHNEIIEAVKSLNENIKVEGIFSHFSVAYYKNNKHTREQYTRFTHLLTELEKNDININLKHICNSPAFLNYPEMHLNAARIGSAFVGRVCSENNIGLKKVGQIAVNIAEIRNVPKGFNISYLNTYKTKKETKIAILPIGYLEGYNLAKKEDMFRNIDKIRNIVRGIKELFKEKKLTAVINEKRYDIIGTIRNVSHCS